MILHTTEILDRIVALLTAAIPTATVSRQYAEIDQLSQSKGDFPRVSVLWGGGEQGHQLGRASMDEQLEAVLVLYVHDTADEESALMTLFKAVLSALAPALVVTVGGVPVEHGVDLSGIYTTSRQSVRPFGWLVKRIHIHQRFTV
jgi:hypothetical protein